MSYPMGYAYKISKSMMPKISDTERAALNAGTGAWLFCWVLNVTDWNLTVIHDHILVGFDREIFSGNPSLKDLEKYSVKLSPEEKGTSGPEIEKLVSTILSWRQVCSPIALKHDYSNNNSW